MVRSLFVGALVVMGGRFPVMVGRFLVMLGRFAMVIRCLFRHVRLVARLSPDGACASSQLEITLFNGRSRLRDAAVNVSQQVHDFRSAVNQRRS